MAIVLWVGGVWVLIGGMPWTEAIIGGYVFTPLMPLVPFGELLDEEFMFFANNAIVLGFMLILQWMLLRPGRRWTARMAKVGRPLKSSVIAGAFAAMLLTVGAIAIVMELPNWWEDFIMGNEVGFYGCWVGMALLWLIWGVVFWVYWKEGDRYSWLARLTRGLIAGSVLEFAVAVPVHIWATRQRECYCARGTYTGLIFAGTVLLWAFGPGVVLLFMREKYRRQKLLEPVCAKCGYDLRGTIAAGRSRCPECGEAFALPKENADREM